MLLAEEEVLARKKDIPRYPSNLLFFVFYAQKPNGRVKSSTTMHNAAARVKRLPFFSYLSRVRSENREEEQAAKNRLLYKSNYVSAENVLMCKYEAEKPPLRLLRPTRDIEGRNDDRKTKHSQFFCNRASSVNKNSSLLLACYIGETSKVATDTGLPSKQPYIGNLFASDIRLGTKPGQLE